MDPVAKVKETYQRYHPRKVYRYVMGDTRRQVAAVGVVLILIVAIFAVLSGTGGEEEETASLDDLLASQSTRTMVAEGGSIVAYDEDPFYAVISTPVAVHYEETGDAVATPLLVSGDDPELSVNRFLLAYNRPTVITVGPVDGLSVPTSMNVLAEDVKHTSVEVAETFWSRSDGAMIVEGDQEGYDLAVAGAALASYLDIPVIVTDEICSGVAGTLEGLGVDYTVCLGNAPGYGRVYRLQTLTEVQDTMASFIKDPMGLGGEVGYLTIANPHDVVPMEVVDTTTFHFEDLIYDHSARDNVLAGTTPVPSEADYDFEVPGDYEFCNVHFTLKFRQNRWADEIGSRIYVYAFDGDEELDGSPAMETFFGTPAGRIEGEYRIVDFDLPLNNDTGPHLLSLMAREVWSGSPPGPAGLIRAEPEWFYLDVVVQRLETPVYPLIEGVSAMAPYLTAFRQGITMASPSYALMNPSYQGCVACDEPTINEKGLWAANVKAMEVHNETVETLARLVGVETEGLMEDHDMLNELADHYYYNPVSVGIIADTNMVPHYYFPGGMAQEGYGEPGDIIYGDINMDPLDPPNDVGEGRVHSDYPDLELPVGRIDGYGVGDVSALLSRTFFYHEIIDAFNGYQQGDVHTEWKNNGYVFLGSEIPVESMYPSLITQINSEFSDGGLNPKSTTELLSHRENSQKFQEGSNYIIGGVHGFYYWYVPAARTKYSGGSAYDVAHVRDMDFGPSTMYMISCVVGRMDGLHPENSLALTYMHGGMNAYIGATRSTYGWLDAGSDGDVRLDSEGAVLMGEYFSEYVLAEDQSVGLALRNAKNDYIVEDGLGGYINDLDDHYAYMIYGHYILHGDPAFNPYEPNNP